MTAVSGGWDSSDAENIMAPISITMHERSIRHDLQMPGLPANVHGARLLSGVREAEEVGSHAGA